MTRKFDFDETSKNIYRDYKQSKDKAIKMTARDVYYWWNGYLYALLMNRVISINEYQTLQEYNHVMRTCRIFKGYESSLTK